MLSALIFLSAALALLLFPGAVQSGVASGISYCLVTLAPSLFPFMVLSGFAADSPAASVLGRPLGPIARYLFRLPPCCAVPILMGFTGGYPAGAKGVSLLLAQGRVTREQAGRMLMFCVNPGLAFTVTYLGVGVFGSAAVGWRLFLCVTIPSVAMGIAAGLRSPVPPRPEASSAAPPPPGALTRSVSGAARSVLVMCACIVLFSGLNSFLHASGVFQGIVRLLSHLGIFTPQGWAAAVSFLLEVTGGTGDARALGVGPAFFAFGLAFGGICVHMQIISLFGELPVRLPVFLLSRLVHGLLAAGCFLLTGRLFPGGSVPAMAGAAYQTAGLSGSWMGGASLVLLCTAFLLMAPGEWHKSPLAKPSGLLYTK